MRHLLPHPINESIDPVQDLLLPYRTKHGPIQPLGKIGKIEVVSVDRSTLKHQHPEWEDYIGSHHWGKKTQYIPDHQIWIAQDLDDDTFVRVVNHEIIERRMMKGLVEKGMTSEEAWAIAHPRVKAMGF
jgi:hypothetical protein